MRRSVLGGLAVCLTLALSGCGGDDTAADSPTSSGSPTTSTSSSTGSPTNDPSPDDASESPTSEASSSSDTYASFTPVAGTELTGPTTAISAPTEWGNEPLQASGGGNISDPRDPRFNIALDDSNSVTPQTLDELVDAAYQFAAFDDDVQRLDDVTLAGIPAYHIAGKDTQFLNYIDEFGFDSVGREVRIRISTTRGYDPAKREQLIGSVLASFRFTG